MSTSYQSTVWSTLLQDILIREIYTRYNHVCLLSGVHIICALYVYFDHLAVNSSSCVYIGAYLCLEVPAWVFIDNLYYLNVLMSIIFIFNYTLVLQYFVIQHNHRALHWLC